MRFLIDAMLPPGVADELTQRGHHAVTPKDLGAANLPDRALIELSAREGFVIVTENARDFSRVTECPVLLVRKSWWPPGRLRDGLTEALARWASAHPEPGHWTHWLSEEYR